MAATLYRDGALADGRSAHLRLGVSLLVADGTIAWIRPSDDEGPLPHERATAGEGAQAGVGATATATVNGAGQVTGIAVGAQGAGYTKIAPVVSITPVGSGAAATAVISSTGTITSYNVSNGGSGYGATPPRVTITGGGGAGATATATVVGGVEA